MARSLPDGRVVFGDLELVGLGGLMRLEEAQRGSADTVPWACAVVDLSESTIELTFDRAGRGFGGIVMAVSGHDLAIGVSLHRGSGLELVGTEDWARTRVVLPYPVLPVISALTLRTFPSRP